MALLGHSGWTWVNAKPSTILAQCGSVIRRSNFSKILTKGDSEGEIKFISKYELCFTFAIVPHCMQYTWRRRQMKTFSALLALCAGNLPVTGEFPAQRPVTRSFDVFFDLRLNKW